MASIQRIVSPLTREVVYRVQVRRKGRAPESATFPNRKEAVAWAESLESAIREGRHFPHAAAKRTSFDALAKDYVETVLGEFASKERLTRDVTSRAGPVRIQLPAVGRHARAVRSVSVATLQAPRRPNANKCLCIRGADERGICQ
jgi:hypothetical protein